jgi:predicted enzyme related to lactoylglutathione lyase
MPEVTSHAPGTASWFELSTTDEKGAMEFYSAIFGWVDDPHRSMRTGPTICKS